MNLLSLSFLIACKFRDICYCLKSFSVGFFSPESEAFLIREYLFLAGSLEVYFGTSLALLIGSNRTPDFSLFFVLSSSVNLRPPSKVDYNYGNLRSFLGLPDLDSFILINLVLFSFK